MLLTRTVVAANRVNEKTLVCIVWPLFLLSQSNALIIFHDLKHFPQIPLFFPDWKK